MEDAERLSRNKREAMLMAIIGRYVQEIESKYPGTASLFAAMQADIIALIIDWD